MKKFSFLMMAFACLTCFAAVGCGTPEPSVVEAPPAEEVPDEAGADEEDYDPTS